MLKWKITSTTIFLLLSLLLVYFEPSFLLSSSSSLSAVVVGHNHHNHHHHNHHDVSVPVPLLMSRHQQNDATTSAIKRTRLLAENEHEDTPAAAAEEEEEAGGGSEGEEGGEEEEEDEEEEEKEGVSALSPKGLGVICSIAVILIAITAAFEHGKEYLEESISEDMQPTLAKFFGELTILGFVSMLVFVITETGEISYLSELIFDGDDEELLEYLESVHYAIFSIMIFFVVQVVFLMRYATISERDWMMMENTYRQYELNNSCHGDGDGNGKLTPIQSPLEVIINSKRSWYSRIFPFLLPSNERYKEEEAYFIALRKEFILDRSVEPPFHSIHDEQVVGSTSIKRLNSVDFNFGRYLSLSQVYCLSHSVNIRDSTWLFFAIGCIIFYLVALSVHGRGHVMGTIWICVSYMLWIFNLIYERHLRRVRDCFVPRSESVFHSSSAGTGTGTDNNNESTPLVVDDDTDTKTNTNGASTNNALSSSSSLPSWCDIDIEHYMKHIRPWFVHLSAGGTPNRQQAILWYDRRGPGFSEFILQVNLLYEGLYVCGLIRRFFPYWIMSLNGWSFYFIAVLIFAVAPMFGITISKSRLLALMTQVCSIGCYRKAQIVSEVLQEERTARVVRTFVILHKIHHVAKNARVLEDHIQKQSKNLRGTTLGPLEIHEVTKIFEAFDNDSSGAINYDEFKSLLLRLGADLSDDDCTVVISHLDCSNDGEISKEEFLYWYEDLVNADDISVKERARDMFALFSNSNCSNSNKGSNGEITTGEFIMKLKSLQMGFNVNEIGSIVNKIDINNTGVITVHEFEMLFEKYCPKQRI